MVKKKSLKKIEISLILCLTMIVLYLGNFGCGKEEKTLPALPTVTPQQKLANDFVKKKKKKIVEKYEYKGIKYRNPLLPLTAKATLIEGTGEMAGTNLATLSLKGFIKDNQKGGLALISDINGASYIVKDKRLINQQGKKVEGVVGIIKDKSVVLITSDQSVRELKLKTEEEEY